MDDRDDLEPELEAPSSHRDPSDELPACDTGPAGRVRFVLRELRDLLRRR